MNEIEIKVFRFLADYKEQVLMVRRCVIDSDDTFPFATIEYSLRILFGKDCYITFTICPYEKR